MFQETASKAEKATRAEGLRVRRAGRALQLATRRAGQSRSGRVVGQGMEESGGLLPWELSESLHPARVPSQASVKGKRPQESC